MNRADLIKVLMDTELAGRRHLSRVQARAVVNEVFKIIAEALQNREVVRLPVGALAVTEQRRKPTRSWFLDRVRVTYKERNQIVFGGGKYDPEPTEVTDNDVQPNKQGSRRPKLSPLERRKLAVIGVKAGKSKRSIAKELGVSARTIHRDLKNPRKPTKKTRSAGARRKPDTPQKAELPKGTQQRKRTITPVRMPNAPIELQEQLKMSSDSEKSKTPEEIRQLRLQEMVQLADSWLAEQRRNYWRAINVVDKARNRLNTSSYGYFRGIPEPSKRAAELRDQNRPEEMDSASSQSLLRREEVCAQWLARWMAAWAPRDEELRNEVFNQVRAKQRVYPYFG